MGLSDDQPQPTNIHEIMVAEVNDIPHGVYVITKELPAIYDYSQETQKNSDTPVTIGLDPEGWYTQSEVKGYLNPTININTQKSMISKAVKARELQSNGEKGK